MNYPKEVSHFADMLVYHYAKFDSLNQRYDLNLEDLPDFDQHKFCSHVLLKNKELANEATGCDNPTYDTKMLPALIRYMSNTTDKDKQADFNQAWKDGLLYYVKEILKKIIKKRVEIYNQDQGYTQKDEPNYQSRSNNLWLS